MGLLDMVRGGRGGGGGSGMRITWIIGLVLAAVGLFKYFGGSQTNPVTGKAERVAMSPQQEISLGMATAPKMMAEMGGEVPRADPRSRIVQEVGQKLVAQIGKADMPWKFDFHLINDPKTVNAFALPGGQCFVTTALFSQLQNEAQLAGVLGHEIGHVIERHSAERMAKQQLGQSLVNAVAVGASGDGGGYTAAQIANMANGFLQMRYGREDELESDHYGVEYMTKAGYDPEEMVGVMEILKKASGGGRGQPEFMSTHPDPGNRADQIRQQVKTLFPNGKPAGLSKGRSLQGGGNFPGGPGPGTAPPPARRPTEKPAF